MTANNPYDAAFFEHLLQESSESAALAVPVLLDLLEVTSVLDVGGGVGAWGAAFRSAGVAEVVTVDGDYVDRSRLLVPTFIAHDLTLPLDLGRSFDLVIALEVAEHLPATAAATFVESLTRHGELILFSAAIPGQGGRHHVNERWPTYWREHFARHDFQLHDVIRPRIWHKGGIAVFFRQNMLVFAHGDASERLREVTSVPAPVDVVHPELFRSKIDRYEVPPTIRRSAALLRGALLRRARRTLSRSPSHTDGTARSDG